MKKFLKDESGASMVEYGLLVGLIAIVCITAVENLGQAVNNVFTDAYSTLASKVPGAA